MQNKNCKVYLDGIRDLRAMANREGGSSKSSSKGRKRVVADQMMIILIVFVAKRSEK